MLTLCKYDTRPATPVHLKLFNCRQALSARSRLLHLVSPPFLCLPPRVCVYLYCALLYVHTHTVPGLGNVSEYLPPNHLSPAQVRSSTQWLKPYCNINQHSITLSSFISAWYLLQSQQESLRGKLDTINKM